MQVAIKALAVPLLLVASLALAKTPPDYQPDPGEHAVADRGPDGKAKDKWERKAC